MGSEGTSGCASSICVVAAAFCNCDGCNHENAEERLMNEILYAENSVLMSDSIEKLREIFNGRRRSRARG